MMYIPIGMQAARPDTHPPDLAYNQTVLVIVGEIRRMMGVPIHQNEQETTHTQILLLDALGQVATEMLAVLYPGKNIRAVLMNRIRADREMSLELVKQGGMSPETFEVLHPPPDAKPKSSSSSASGTSSASQTRSMRKRFEEDY